MRHIMTMTTNQDFVETFKKLDNGKYQIWQLWSDFIYMSAVAISNVVDKAHFAEREQEYIKIKSKYTPKELEVFPELLANLVMALERCSDQDLLGSLYMQLELGNHWKGQFFTPYIVCRLMADINSDNAIDQIKSKGYVEVNDPACGAGALLIAYANSVQHKLYKNKSELNWQNHILFTAQDVDMVTGLMCYIQLSLLGCAGYIKIDDTLANPMNAGDKLDNYWFTPMYFSNVWQYRRIFHGFDTIMRGRCKEEKTNIKKDPHFPPKCEMQLIERNDGQLTLF